jgi:predicted DNA-binding protein
MLIRPEDRQMTGKAMSLRLPKEQAAELAAIARADDMPVSKVVREAIDSHIAARRADKDFQKRLKRRMEEDREVLERLAR